MPRAKQTSSQKLRQLRQKHSDAVGKTRLKLVRDLGVAPAVGKSKKSNASTQIPSQFTSSAALVTPFKQREAFRSLYSFLFLQLSLLAVWIGYRAFVQMPVWFDEGVAKAIVFGFPVFWMAARSKFIALNIGLNKNQLLPGLYLGLAIGGLYGFAGVFMNLAQNREVVAAPLYTSDTFWWLALLALLTAWWESLFFFGLPIQFLRSTANWLSESVIISVVLFFFLAFHAPLRLMTAGANPQFVVQMFILTLFAFGQYLVYTRTRNMYTVVLSHCIWGLVLEIYSR